MTRAFQSASFVARQACLVGTLLLVLGAAAGAGEPPVPAQPEVAPVMPDVRLEEALVRRLENSDAVEAHRVDVEAEQGVVTLSGQVGNLLARDRAVSVAEATRGVVDVRDRLAVRTTEREDSAIAEDVREVLQSDAVAEAFELSTSVSDGVVTLRGTVESYQEKRVAENLVTSIRGVRGVENGIDVVFAVDRPDAEIREEVVRRLENDSSVGHYRITVTVEDATVRLSGAVGSVAERVRAREDAWVAGVRGVESDDLEVRWWASEEMVVPDAGVNRNDALIAGGVRQALRYEPYVLDEEVSVEVEDGVAYLEGTVQTARGKARAGDAAGAVSGVRRVRNHLRVRGGARPQDTELLEDVREALARDPYVDRFGIDVRVRNNKAYLSGEVDTRFQKRRAAEAARGVEGVVEVANNLQPAASTAARKSDAELQLDVEAQINWNPDIAGRRVRVSVDDGVATLEGTVLSSFQRREATREAFEAGARRVDNNLTVRRSPEYTWP
jgi:osmotically-inducible protein OsmY